MAPPKGSIEVGEATKGETKIRRSYTTPDALLTTPADGIEVLPDVVARSARMYGTKNALGWRDIIKVHKEDKEITKTVKGKETKETKTWECV